MTQTGTKPRREIGSASVLDEPVTVDVVRVEPVADNIGLLRLVWTNRTFVGRAVAVALAIGTLVAFLLPKTFESTAQLMPPDNQSSSGLAMLAVLSGNAGGMGALASGLMGMRSSGALFVGMLHSHTVEDELVNRFDLRKVYGAKTTELARRKLEMNTSISEDIKSGILSIRVTDRDPQRAAALAAGYVESLDRVVAQLSTSSARREREFLEQRLTAVQADLEKAEKDFSQFASKNGAIDIKEQGRAMVDAAATLEGQMIAAKSELEGLRQIYTDNNVRVRATVARVAELQAQIDRVAGKGESSSGTVGGQQDSGYPSIRRLPLLGVTYADLYRRTKVEEAVFEALTHQYELAKVQEAKETPTVRVLDRAQIPEIKSFPPRLVIMFVSTFLGLCFSVFWIISRESWAAMDSRDPRKILASEIFQTLSAYAPWASPNGSRVHGVAHRLWTSAASHRSAQPVKTSAKDL